jgi:hypothetical protein
VSKYLLLLIAAALVLLYLFFPRGDDPREIESVFGDMRNAAEKKDADGVAEHFSLQYKDEYGATYPVVKKVIGNVFLKYDSVRVSYSGLSVVFSENESGEKEAAANLDVTITGYLSGMPHDLIGSESSPDNVTVTLKKSGLGGWKITGVEGLDAQESY